MSCGPRRPVRLANSLLRAAGRLGIRPGSLQPEAIIEQAVVCSGNEDFGAEDGWREGLARLCSDFRGPARLSPIGRISAHRHLVDLLANRLWLQADRTGHPEIAATAITRPLFIVGLPRTGTTLLHMLLAQDPAHRVPQVWEVMHPAPASESEQQRKARSARELAWMERLAPDLKVMHPLAPELPQECIAIDSHTLQSQEFQTTHNVPNYQRWYERQPLVPVYRFHRRFVQWLNWQRPGRRWVLKAPAHLFGLNALLEVYPDAAIIQTHRDPVDTIPSIASFIHTLWCIYGAAPDAVAAGREWSALMARAFAATEAARQTSPAAFLDVQFLDTVKRPMDVVRAVYAHSGMVLSADAEAAMQTWLAANGREKRETHEYAAPDFGLSAEQIARDFADYRSRHIAA